MKFMVGLDASFSTLQMEKNELMLELKQYVRFSLTHFVNLELGDFHTALVNIFHLVVNRKALFQAFFFLFLWKIKTHISLSWKP